MAEEFGEGVGDAEDSEEQQILDDLTVLGDSANADLSAVQQVGGIGPDGIGIDDPNVLSSVHQGSRMTADEVLANLVDEGAVINEETGAQPELSQTAPLDQADIPASAPAAPSPVEGQAAPATLEGGTADDAGDGGLTPDAAAPAPEASAPAAETSQPQAAPPLSEESADPAGVVVEEAQGNADAVLDEGTDEAFVNTAADVSATTASLSEDGSLTITQDMLLEGASDVDGDSLTAQNLSTDQGTLTDNDDGTWSFTPDADWNGSLDISYDVSDGTTTTPNSMAVTVDAVNDAADVSATTASLSEDGSLTITQDMLLEGASDVDGDSLTAQNLSSDQGTLTDNGDGTWTFTPDADWNGSLDISYDVSDGTTTTPNSMAVTVDAVNDAADVSATTASLSEDGSLTITQDMLLEGASDVDGDSLTAQNLSTDQGTLTDNGDGTWSFTPDADWNGSLDISYDVSDGTTTTPNSMAVTVDAVNDAADVSATTASLSEDGSLTITQDMLLEGASDVDGDSLTAQNLSTDQGTLTDNGDGTWTFTPDDDWNGSLDISYDVSDGTTTTPNSMAVTVDAVNDTADVSATTASLSEDGSLTITQDMLLEGASDVDGDSLTAQNLSTDQGTLADNGDGTWTFTPDDDWNGSLDISYDVSDGTTTTPNSMAVTVDAVNDAADVSATTASLSEDGSLTITQDMLLEGASDVDGDSLTAQNLSTDQGTLTDNGDGTWSFTPDDDWNGSLDISYDVSDGTTTTPNSMAVTVDAVNDAADVSATTASLSEDGSLTITQDMLLEGASDVDGDSLTAQNLSTDQGTLTDNGDGTWSFTPDADWNGSLDISYDVSDGTTTTPNSMAVTVDAVNDAADVSATSATMDEDTSMTITQDMLLEGASDVDGDSLTAQNLSTDQGTLTDNGDGTWAFTPDDDWNGSLDISYDVSDGATTTANTMSVTVDDVAEAPTPGVTLTGGEGSDTLTGGGGDDVLSGGEGDDTLSGAAGDDALSGGKGDDALDGGSGDDSLDGGKGDDNLDGGAGDDVLLGGKGDDTLVGGAGDDTLTGGEGDDVMTGGDGDDTFYGGDGDDNAFGSSGNDLFIFGSGDGEDYFQGGSGWTDTIQLEDVSGGPGDSSGWTLQVDNGASYTETSGGLEFEGDASGTIQLSDGSELSFDGVDKIEW